MQSHKFVLSGLALASLLSLAGRAGAQESAAPPAVQVGPAVPSAPEQLRDTRWYGWETLIADGASTAVLAASAKSQSNAVAGVGIGLFALGAPLVHVSKGHPERAAADIAMRVLTPLLCGLIGYEVGSTNRTNTDWDRIGDTSVGLFVGYAAAVTVDAAWLARDEVSSRSPQVTVAREVKPQWSPTVSVTPKGASLGLAASF